MAISKIPSAGFQDNVKFRNIIINGDMSIAQRGTSATGLGNGDSGYHTVDRYRFAEGGSPTFEFTQSQSTDVPTGQGFATSLKMDCTTADASLATDDLIRIDQRFEGQNLQYLKKGTSSAESLTLSFWVKSNKTGTYIVEFFDSDNTRQISQSYTINSSSTWEKKTITIAGDTTGSFDNDNNLSLQFSFYLVAGTNYTSGTLNTSWGASVNANRAVGQVNLADSTDNEWYITGVQLEASETASDFEFLPVDVNLNRCERYYQTLEFNNIVLIGNSFSAAEAVGINTFNKMRTAPTVTLPATGQSSGQISYITSAGNYPSTIGSHSATPISNGSFRHRGQGYSGLTSTGVSWLYVNGACSILLDAEL
ncbi:hypothetical protein N9349_05305 [Candidatus Pelagibacter sp.]|nr:hypothetical protein [Candidatus Pelagibacter sp.]